MKKLLLSLVTLFSLNAFAKPVDVPTAQRAAYNFIKSKVSPRELQNAATLELVYTSQKGAVNNFYVFNVGNTGFVMISADDQVVPVFGYSTEAGFDAQKIPTNTKTWLDNYANEIAYVVENNLPASAAISENWTNLLSTEQSNSGNKSTAVTPLLTTKWGQDPYVNDLCPLDIPTNSRSVSGCVATAMVQIMKYWNYPTQGIGSYSYTHWDYGLLQANFGATTYQWNSMPNIVSSANNAVATLMYHAGVSVNMNYSPSGSGAYVVSAMGPQSAENALKTYFGYDPSLKAEFRNGTQAWIQTLKTEINNSRPVLYAGFGSSGGHAWIADGYDNNDFFHINWGWSGMSDGYFLVDNMNPPALGQGGGSGGFYNNQHAIIGIKPLSTSTPDQYEQNNAESAATNFPVTFSNNIAKIVTTGSTIHNTNDLDHYIINLPVGDNYEVSARLQDANFSNNGNIYTLNAKFAYKTGTPLWSSYYDDQLTNPISVTGGGTVMFKVAPFVTAGTGSYMLDVTVTRIPTGISSVENNNVVNVYPNPATNVINIDLQRVIGKADVAITDIQGRTLIQSTYEGQHNIVIPVDMLTAGVYFVKIASKDANITEKVVINK
jgi:hypothetical protein